MNLSLRENATRNVVFQNTNSKIYLIRFVDTKLDEKTRIVFVTDKEAISLANAILKNESNKFLKGI